LRDDAAGARRAMQRDRPGGDLRPVALHQTEQVAADKVAAVDLRRELVAEELLQQGGTGELRASSLNAIPYDHFDVAQFYNSIYGKNCENVIGFVPLPVGVVGPLVVNGESFMVPMATTEGALVASTSRGAKAIREAGGAACEVVADGMSRSPVVVLPSLRDAAALKAWIEDPTNFEELAACFGETTSHGKLKTARATVAGRYVYIRFTAHTGDAMGMNMVGKGVNQIMQLLVDKFDGLELVSLSSNMCTDKKPSAVNWTQGRGKSVVSEVVLSRAIVEDVLKTTIPDLVRLNTAKNLVGSALTGSIGGNNAHAANLVTAVFLATGQDPAQNVESSNCLMQMEATDGGESLHVTATMPCIEVGTLGGGTDLAAQNSCLGLLGVAGANRDAPGANARKLATIVCATVLAGELSLNAALATNHLISAHMKLNRRQDDQATTDESS